MSSNDIAISVSIYFKFTFYLCFTPFTQIQQEQVESSTGGLINGVQSGLNSSMNTIKFILVILLPQPQTFGWLILTSFCSVCLGGILFGSFAAKKSSMVGKN